MPSDLPPEQPEQLVSYDLRPLIEQITQLPPQMIGLLVQHFWRLIPPEPPRLSAAVTGYDPDGPSGYAILHWLHELPPDSPEWKALGAWWRTLTPAQQRYLRLPLVERLSPGRERLSLRIADIVRWMEASELEATALFIASVVRERKGELYTELGEILKGQRSST